MKLYRHSTIVWATPQIDIQTLSHHLDRCHLYPPRCERYFHVLDDHLLRRQRHFFQILHKREKTLFTAAKTMSKKHYSFCFSTGATSNTLIFNPSQTDSKKITMHNRWSWVCCYIWHQHHTCYYWTYHQHHIYLYLNIGRGFLENIIHPDVYTRGIRFFRCKFISRDVEIRIGIYLSVEWYTKFGRKDNITIHHYLKTNAGTHVQF